MTQDVTQFTYANSITHLSTIVYTATKSNVIKHNNNVSRMIGTSIIVVTSHVHGLNSPSIWMPFLWTKTGLSVSKVC